MYGIVFKTENLTNGKLYIGQTYEEIYGIEKAKEVKAQQRKVRLGSYYRSFHEKY